MDRTERAIELEHSGCNCAQAVLCAVQDQFDLPKETLMIIVQNSRYNLHQPRKM